MKKDDVIWGSVILGVVLFLLWAFIAGVTGVNTNYWERVNDKCWVHVTQDKNAWLTAGDTKPEVRTDFCESELKGVLK